MEQLQCVVERITFQNKNNGFAIIKCEAQGYKDLVVALGKIPDVNIGGIFTLYGNWKNDPKWGMQFVFQSYEQVLPATLHGIEKYLGSGLIKGIGPTYAKKIVEHFGKNTLKILDIEPDRLAEVQGIGQKRLNLIKQSWVEQQTVKNIMLFLQDHDVSTSLARKIYRTYGSRSLSIVKSNPYQLADEIWGIGFKTADSIAAKLGLSLKSSGRIRSGILYSLNQASEAGHCFLYQEQLLEASIKLLNVDTVLIMNTLKKMIRDKDVIQENTDKAVYLPIYYHSEVGTAERLLTLLNTGRNFYLENTSPRNIKNMIIHKSVRNIKYDDIQLKAIQAALDNKVFVLTGGPGTGKTTTTIGIINAYKEVGAKILLAAPTGRAAKRMSEVTGMEAKTIHRMLEMRPGEGFQRNEEHPLKGDVLIVDECSMVDILLMYALLKAMPEDMTLILVGDVDQLPSVGAGRVLKDILESGVISYIKLERIFRQAQKSKIITNAHKINKGEFPYIRDNDSDFKFFDIDDPEEAARFIVSLCSEILPKQYNISPNEIQVLAPMRRGAIGTTNLNLMLQSALNPLALDSKTMMRGSMEFRVNDKVMQLRNNYDKSVFNGDIGFVTEIETNEYGKRLVVNFDSREIKYEQDEIDELILAYATTIHKSQGSEFPYVVMPIMTSHFIMLQKNLLYTGVTRAKQGLIIVGETKAIYIAVKNNKIIERNTNLSNRLAKKEADITWINSTLTNTTTN